MKEKTTQIRPSIGIDTALILEMIAKKTGKGMGTIIQEFLEDSPRWREQEKKLKDFKAEF